MDQGDDGLGGAGEDEDNIVLSNECEICGSTEFLSEAGFYYCKLCNTQSQQSRQYIEEELVPDRSTNLRQVSVLQKGKVPQKVKCNINGKKIWLSTWEIYNLVIEGMTRALVGVGFPPRLRDKVFQIWSAYLLKRKVIFVNPKSPDEFGSRLTNDDYITNIYSLFDVERPRWKMYKDRPEKRKATLDEDQNSTGLAQAKRKKTMSRRKAFEKEYLQHASQMSALDETYENVTGTNNETIGVDPGLGTSLETQEKPSISKLKYTAATQKFRSILKAYRGSKKQHTGQNNTGEFCRISKLMKVERFGKKTVLILLFVAARQIGCRVMYSDFIRLFNDGTLYVENLRNLCNDKDQFSNYQPLINQFLKVGRFMQITPRCCEDIEAFIEYIGIKRFLYPTYEEMLPKFIDDFVLPKEFECLLRELNTMFSLDNTVDDLRPSKKDLRVLIELWVLTIMVVGMKMLFGLDDVTEKYQSRFASTVNRIIAGRLSRPNLSFQEKILLKRKSADYLRLFVLEDWFKYLRTRENLISLEMLGKEYYRPNCPLNMRRASDIIDTYSDFRRSMGGELNESCVNVTKLFHNLGKNNGGVIPELPSYMTLPLPKQSILNQYKRAHPIVGHPELESKVLDNSFDKTRIDFIWNPKKYIPMLKKAGYKVKVIPGDAVNYKKKLKFQEKKLILFQPYKAFDDITPRNCTQSMKFLIGRCSEIISGVMKFGDEPNESRIVLHSLLNLVSKMYSRRAMTDRVPLKEPAMFSTSN